MYKVETLRCIIRCANIAGNLPSLSSCKGIFASMAVTRLPLIIVFIWIYVIRVGQLLFR